MSKVLDFLFYTSGAIGSLQQARQARPSSLGPDSTGICHGAQLDSGPGGLYLVDGLHHGHTKLPDYGFVARAHGLETEGGASSAFAACCILEPTDAMLNCCSDCTTIRNKTEGGVYEECIRVAKVIFYLLQDGCICYTTSPATKS